LPVLKYFAAMAAVFIGQANYSVASSWRAPPAFTAFVAALMTWQTTR
jgi:hypothetical protein